MPNSAFGMRPVYITSIEATTIRSEGPRDFTDARGFLIQGDTLFIVEQLAGIHVIDNRDPTSPVAVAFISVPGCTSVTSIGRFLYVNNTTDLVTLDVSDVNNVVVVDREVGLYPAPLDFPEDHIGYFECYDPARGVLAGWEPSELANPECLISFQ